MADNAPQTQAAPSPAPPVQTPDAAEQILRSAPGIDDNTRANAWDAFHQSASEDDLAGKLQNLNLPNDVKANLWDAKHSASRQAAPTGSPATEGISAGVEAGAKAANFFPGGQATVGFMKGAAETAHTIGAYGSTLLNAVTGGATPTIPTQEPAYLEAQGPEQTVGKVGEGIAEFLLGDEALKGLSLVEKAKQLGNVGKVLDSSPKLAKAVELGVNAMRQGAVGATQTLAKGGTPGQALATGAVVGGAGAAFEGFGQGVKAVKNYVTRTEQAEQVGQDLVKGLTQGATPEQVARTVQRNLDAAEAKMSATYDQGMQAVSAKGANVPVPIAGSPLQQTAKDLLSNSRVPESIAENLKGVIPDSSKIEPFLQQLASSSETLTWDQMEATRQAIGKTIRKLPFDSSIRPDLIQLRYAIDDTLESAAEKSGNPQLSDQIKSVRGQFAQTKSMLEERAITALRDKNPNAVADILLNKESVHNVDTLRRLIGPENMTAVEGSILDKMVQDSSKNGVLQGRQLFRKFNSLGPDAKQAIWGDRLPQVTEFMQMAGRLDNVILDRIVHHYAPYAVGGGALLQAEHGDLKGAAKTVGTGLLVAAILKNPAVLEYVLKGIRGAGKAAVPAASAGLSMPKSDENAPEGGPISENWIQDLQQGGKEPVQARLSDGRTIQVHPEDLDELKQRDLLLQQPRMGDWRRTILLTLAALQNAF